MDVSLKQLVVALESLGYQCQYIDGSLLAHNGGQHQLSFVEASDGTAVGTFPGEVMEAARRVTEEQVQQRFSEQMLHELGYGEFSPSKAKPTGVGDTSSSTFQVKSGDQTVTDETPQKGPTKPQNATDLPGDFTGDSDNNEDADIPSTGGDSAAATVGAHGAPKTGSPGPNTKGPERTQAMKVGHSLQQMDAPNSDSGDYDGTKVGSVGAGGSQKAGATTGSKGSAPDLPPGGGSQPAQSLPKIPSPGKGKMAVTKSKMESVLSGIMTEQEPTDEQDAQMAEQQAGKKLYVISRTTPEDSWTVNSAFESTSVDTIRDAREASASFLQANPQGGSLMVFSDSDQSQIEQGLADGREPTELGDSGVAQGKVEEAGSPPPPVKKEKPAESLPKMSPEQIDQFIESLPKSFNLIDSIHPGPYISRRTLRKIDLHKVEEQLTPVFARMILEQDEDEDDDAFDAPPPPPPGEGEEGAEGGAPGGEAPEGDEELDDAGMGGPEGMEGEDPDADMGASPGAPIDIDIGDEPAPQPVGDEQGAPGIEPGAPEPKDVGDKSRWQKAQELCPDCDEDTIEELVQVDIIGDLYQAVMQQVMAKAASAMKQEEEPLVASQQPNKSGQATTKLAERSGNRISAYVREKRLREAWTDDPRAFVDALVDGLTGAPDKIERAARLVLGLKEADYIDQDIQEARSILDGLNDQVREVRNQIQEVRLSSVGKIQALVSSKFARGAFASEAQQMMDHLLKVEENLNAFLAALDRYQEDFDQRYGDVASAPDADVLGEEPPPPSPTEGPGAEVPPPPSEVPEEEPVGSPAAV